MNPIDHDLKDEQMPSLQERMTWLLHDLDPINTCCKYYLDLDNLYRKAAQSIVRQLEAGVSLQQAVRQTFDDQFWEGCLETTNGIVGLDIVLAALEAEMKRPSAEVESDGALELHRAMFERYMTPIPRESRWTYEGFMRRAPIQIDQVQIDDDALLRGEPIQIDQTQPEIDEVPPEDDLSVTFIDAARPYTEALLPMLHALLFEKIMRRLPPDQRIDYPTLLSQAGFSPLR